MRFSGIFGIALCMLTTPLAAQTVSYGDDSSDWANDGECDDRRFAGSTISSEFANEDINRDATDCQNGVEAGTLVLWSLNDALKVTQCKAIDFGDDSGEYANDNECDDIRFEGSGMASSVGTESIGKDASDCSSFCDAGVIAVRDY